MAIVKTTTKNPKTLHGILEYVADLNCCVRTYPEPFTFFCPQTAEIVR